MKKYKIEHLDCANCAIKLEDEINKLSHTHAKISFANNLAFIESDDMDSVKDCIKRVEPKVEIYPLDSSKDSMEQSTPKNPKQSFLNTELGVLLALIVVFLCSIGVEYIYVESLASSGENATYKISMIALYALWFAIYAIAGKEVFKGAVRSFKRKEFFDENVLMLTASIAAFLIGAPKEAVSIMLFFATGEYLQNLSLKRSRDSINKLCSFNVPNAHKLDAQGNTIDISPNELRENDEILVYAGEMIPTDCALLSKEANLDISALSGESLPLQAKNGDEILSGSIVLGKVAHLRVLVPFAKSQISKITELIQSAALNKSRTENFITTFARYYTPIVFFVALFMAIIPPIVLYVAFGANLSASFNDWIYRALVVLMVSCPCALVISVPIGYFGGLGACSRLGVLVKGSNYLEALSKVKFIAFDKTGTLTKGVFKVAQVVPQSGISKERLLKTALCAQELSNHPIAQSIKSEYHKYAHHHNIDEFEEISGLGVRAKCDNIEVIAGNDKILHRFHIAHDTCDIEGSVVHIAADKYYLGYIIISDELKSEAFEIVDKLKNLDIQAVVLSGDGEYPCKVVGERLGLGYYHSLLPQDKAERFFALKAKMKDSAPHAVAAFVGDGINDAPTLALADVGISMGSGSDISHQNADVIILNNSLKSLLGAIKIAKKTKIIIYENIALALGIKGVFIVLGAFGMASIWEAVFGDVGVALLALANAMRTMRVRP